MTSKTGGVPGLRQTPEDRQENALHVNTGRPRLSMKYQSGSGARQSMKDRDRGTCRGSKVSVIVWATQLLCPHGHLCGDNLERPLLSLVPGCLLAEGP